MREIKFRAWDKTSKRWVPNDSWVVLPNGGYERFLIFGELEIMQFTGLRDKNGNSIFEGDMVKIYNYKQIWKRNEPPTDWRIFKIVWNRYTWSLNNEYISRPLTDYNTNDLMDYEIEIIGNIYENPELLTN